MNTVPEDGPLAYDVRATKPAPKPNADGFVVRAHCLRAGCPECWEGPEADRQSRLHTEKAHHPTACRTELLAARQRR
jgi:hypothetical protein